MPILHDPVTVAPNNPSYEISKDRYNGPHTLPAHSELSGLGADDHPQYLTSAEGAAAYAALIHATRHVAGGADPIKLDDLAAPDDNTDLNATTGLHGLLRKLSGSAADVLKGDGTWGAGGSSSPEIYVVPGTGTLTTAINAVTAQGGTLLLAPYATGTYEETNLDALIGKTGVKIRGVGNPTGGATSSSKINLNGSGAAVKLLNVADCVSIIIERCHISATSATAYGDLVSTEGSTGQAVRISFRDCIVDAPAQPVFQINGATNATPIVIQTTASHGYATGEFVRVAGVKGNLAANGEQWRIAVVDATHFSLDASVGTGAYTSGGNVANWTRSINLFNTNKSIEGSIRDCALLKGGPAVRGLPNGKYIDGATNATPIVIQTAAAHGYSTNDSVRIEGVKGNTAANSHANTAYAPWIITVVDATHFSLNGSVGNGAFVASNAYANQTAGASIQFSNVWKFEMNETRRNAFPSYVNPGENWTIDTSNAQGKEAPGALADIGMVTHTPGHWATALTIIGNAVYDQTTTDDAAWILFAGLGLTMLGGRYAGRQVTAGGTVVRVDEDGSRGIIGFGLKFNSIFYELDLGATISTSGMWGPNSRDNTAPGAWKYVNRTTERKSFAIMDTGQSLGREFVYFWDDTATTLAATMDGNLVARWSVAGATLLFTAAETRVGLEGRFGYTQTATTHIFGASGGTVAGGNAEGSNANVAMHWDSKGTGVVGIDVLGPGTGGAQISRAAGKVGFFGTAPIAKRTGTPADATDLATALTLVNALKAHFVNYGLAA